MNTLNVQLGNRSYDIIVGSGCLHVVNERIQNESTFMLFDENIKEYAESITSSASMAFQATEKNKVLSSIETVCQSMRTEGIDRTSALIAMGGGVMGDVGGYAAASYMRGIGCIQIPTTLLAMVDASIGGKTGVNMQGDDGVLFKNMIGAFWQPSLVVADVTTLKTLDERQLRCGVAECIKHALLGHSDLMELLQSKRGAILNYDEDALIELVTQSAVIKKEVVEADERETGSRALLNLGHTFAHAIEPIDELDLYHGEAVAIGLCAAASLSEAMGLIDAAKVDSVRDLVSSYGLPISLPVPQSATMLNERMQADKKREGSTTRFVVLSQSENSEGAAIAEDVDEQLVALAWASVGGQLG